MQPRPFWISQGKAVLEDRNKQEKKKRQEKGRKSTEKEKIKNRKGKVGKQSQCF